MSEVLAQVLTGTPKPPRQLIPQASAELEAICLRCLEKDPARRYPSAAALAAALRAADQPETAVAHRGAASVTMKASEPSAALPAPAVPPSAPSHIADRNTRWKTIGVAATALAIVAVGVWLVMTRMPRSDATPEMLAPPEKLRTDFPLTVTMLDDQGNVLKPGPEGLIRLRTDAVVKFRIKVARAAYVGVWSVNSDGTICQLFPNDKEKDHYFKQGEERDVPRTEALAEETQGTAKFEWVWVQAATQPWEADQGKRRGDFLVFQTDEERSQWATSRGTPRGFRLRSEVALTEAVLKYRVAPR